MPPGRRPWHLAAAVFVLLVLVAPLFVGLDRWDMRNDESIYSYAAQRILETGDWLTPRSIPTDFAFVEKPPLKFWIVAGAMSLGLTPTDEFGMRVFDALFGAVAFGYIFAFGWRLGGPFCGAIALLVLLAFDPLIFEHGLRSNNMEAALFLSYCGGLFHFTRWSELGGKRTRHVHALAAGLFFVLGFMTKFVAAVFMPMVAMAVFLSAPALTARLRAGWKDWLVPSVVFLSLVLPWFVYQWTQLQDAFWQEIFGYHVSAPWHYYFTQTWRELEYGDSLLLTLTGLVLLARRVRSEWSSDARLLVIWWLLPYVLISLGTSKLLHYAYPFMPPLALAAGLAGVTIVKAAIVALESRNIWSKAAAYVGDRPRLRATFVVLAIVSAALAVWTVTTGLPATLQVGDVRLFRNSSVARPALLSTVLLLMSGHSAWAIRLAVTAAFLLFLPLQAYEEKVSRALTYDRPIRSVTECMLRLQASGLPRTGVYVSEPSILAHPPYYYLRHTGEWTTGPDGWLEETTSRVNRAVSPVIIGERQWPEIEAALAGRPDVKAVRIDTEGVLLLPGPYAACEDSILAMRGQPFPDPATPQ
jgi:4-amino-4-deoxy-L-arabinose transferase-like glycosyltransferase